VRRSERFAAWSAAAAGVDSGGPERYVERMIDQPVAGAIIAADAEGVAFAAAALARGELVAFATETVYGLGADARSDVAVAAIFAAKGRPAHNPLIVHVADLEAARRYGGFNALAEQLADRFWPGPLTLVLPLRSDAGLSPLVSAGLDTVALRVPAAAVAHRLLLAFAGPVAAPSANISGRLSPTEPEHVAEQLADRVACILDGGFCEQGLESTIVGFEGDTPVLLRPGAIAAEDIETLLGRPLAAPSGKTVTAPGQLASHYAPRAWLRLDAAEAGEGELMLAFGPDAPKGVPGVNLSPAGDLIEAAANLYSYLHLLDDTGVATIAVMPIPMQGVGVAINDRLARAAAPRPEEGEAVG
jgi:L-threonylcarbamoyladenylate synthase